MGATNCFTTKNIIVLTFGYYWDQPIILPKNITHVIFGTEFDRSIILPKNIKHLSLGLWFDQPIVLESLNMDLTIDCDNNHLIYNIPNGIKKITFGYNFSLCTNNDPNDVEIYWIGYVQ